MTEQTPELKLAWAAPREQSLDVQEFAYRLLDRAKENLISDGHLIPLAFVVTDPELRCYGISFGGHEQKEQIYGELIEIARKEKAMAIITVNDAYSKKHKDKEAAKEYVEGYYPGKVAADHDTECIMVAITGPSIPNRTLSVPYSRDNSGNPVFGEVEDEIGGEIGLMQGWACTDVKLH